jgi:uncharacterized protein (DUF934 family)
MPTPIDFHGNPIHAPALVEGVIALTSDSDPLTQELDWFKVARVDIEFPNFTDGRGYSIARLIRSRLQFKGDIRATGDVLVDQLAYMARCGFTSFALRDDQSVTVAKQALKAFSLSYQASHPVTL